MILNNVNIPGQAELQHIQVTGSKISKISSDTNLPEKSTAIQIDLTGAFASPGFINSHDHLDFNLFPQTGNCIYNNYADWGRDIHKNNKAVIDAVLKIPHQLRVQWGIYKNLLNGITTVVNHGKKISINNELVTVLQHNHSLHSVQFEKNWKWKLNNPFIKNSCFVIHLGEGTDDASADEINEVIRWNLFKRKIVAVHGVSMQPLQAKSFNAIVWCPASNFFLLNKTAPINLLKNETNILFGTDSTLTAGWNVWEQLRQARTTNMINDEALFKTITSNAAEVWGLKSKGRLAETFDADIIIAEKKEQPAEWDSFYSIDPHNILLILHKGIVRMFDEKLKAQICEKDFPIKEYSTIKMNGKEKYVHGDVPLLMKEIKKFYPQADFPISY